MRTIVLASQSPQRKNMLATLNIPFQVMPADIDEQQITAHHQKIRAEKVARAKAEAVSQQHPDAIILAGDTYVVFGDKALEKPKDAQEAKQMLQLQSGKSLVEYTGVCYLDPVEKIDESTTIETKIIFRELSEGQIDHYVTTEPVTTWSAAFCPAYDSGAALIDSIEGSLTSFTHGFPMEFFVPLLQRSGIEV